MGACLRVRQANTLQQVNRKRPGFSAFHPAMDFKDLRELCADLKNRVQAHMWILEDHRNSFPAILRPIFCIQIVQRNALEEDLTRHLPSRRPNDPKNRVRGDSLSASRFTHQSKHLTCVDCESDLINGSRDTFVSEEMCLQSFDFQQRG